MTGRVRRGVRARARPGAAGQSTVEFALILPLFFALLVLVFQVALVARDEIVTVHAARVAVREASVTHDPARVTAAARRTLPGAQVRIVQRGPVGEPVTVEVTYVSVTDLPIVGALVPDLSLHATATMSVER
jgi:Flp pilus assembly protein TadG